MSISKTKQPLSNEVLEKITIAGSNFHPYLVQDELYEYGNDIAVAVDKNLEIHFGEEKSHASMCGRRGKHLDGPRHRRS